LDAKTRIKELRKLIKEKGLDGVNRSELGRKFNVSKTQIDRDIFKITKEKPQIHVTSELFNDLQDLNREIKEATRIRDVTKDNRLKAKLTTQIGDMILKRTAIREKIDRLLPSGFKPEPVTIVYRSVNEISRGVDSSD
jgi:hypothetical protein